MYIFLSEAWVPANAGTHAEPLYVFKILYVSFSYTVPGVRHTYILYVSFSYICQIMYYRIYLRNNKKRQQENGVLCLAPSQGSDSGEAPLFVGFSNLGNIVDNFGLHTRGTPIFFGAMLLIRL